MKPNRSRRLFQLRVIELIAIATALCAFLAVRRPGLREAAIGIPLFVGLWLVISRVAAYFGWTIPPRPRNERDDSDDPAR